MAQTPNYLWARKLKDAVKDCQRLMQMLINKQQQHIPLGLGLCPKGPHLDWLFASIIGV